VSIVSYTVLRANTLEINQTFFTIWYFATCKSKMLLWDPACGSKGTNIIIKLVGTQVDNGVVA